MASTKFKSNCKNCYHGHYYKDKCGSCISMTCACGDSTCPSTKLPDKWCFCVDLIPSDNLEYLEWKYEQSQSTI